MEGCVWTGLSFYLHKKFENTKTPETNNKVLQTGPIKKLPLPKNRNKFYSW